MSNLAEMSIQPPRGPEARPMQPGMVQDWIERLANEWGLDDQDHLHKKYAFGNFSDALAFVNRVGQLADEVDHHPHIFLTWGVVRITIWTHSIGGLSEADFIFAAKCDRLFT